MGKPNFNKDHGRDIPALIPKDLGINHMLNINQRCMGGGMSQNYGALYFLEYYIKFFKFEYIIEFGTQKGALALYLANMAEVTEQFIFDTVDISTKDYYSRPDEGVGHWLDVMSNRGKGHVNFGKLDLFHPDVIQVIGDEIGSSGKTLIIADGGDKAREFQTYSPLLKSDDHIMLHDWDVEVTFDDIDQTNPEYSMCVITDWRDIAFELRTTFMPFAKKMI